MKSPKMLVASGALVLSAVVLLPATAEAKATPSKTAICHYDKTSGTWALISVSTSSVASHMKHGDGLPGGAVPGQSGNVFDASCVPTPI